jgi:hypothetical protein
MSERGSDPETYLSQIDQQLRSIQGELQAGRARQAESARGGRTGPLATILGRSNPSAPRRAPAARATPDQAEAADHGALPDPISPSGLVQQVRTMADLQTKLIAAIEDLLEAYEEAGTIALGGEVTLSVGPFADTGALRAFERALAELPGVHRVVVRGYEGEDRAIIDVDLESPPDATP